MNLIFLWILTFAIKLWLGYQFPLFADEMYYWTWSKNLSLSFFDHPPFVAWLFWLGHFFEGFGHSVRWPGILMGHLSFIPWLFLLKNYFSRTDLRIWFAIFMLNPVTGLGSLVITPDVPLLFFWGWALLFYFRAIETSRWHWFALLGIACGLGFCSKYHMALFLPAALIHLYVTKTYPRIKMAHVFLALSMSVLFAAPVLIWNYQNDFVSFRFQLKRGLGQSFAPEWVLDYLGGQLLLVFPTLLYLAFQQRRVAPLNWINAFAWFPLGFFLFASFKGRVEPNWTAIALPAVFALACTTGTRKAWLKRTLWVWGVFIAVFLTHLQWHWLPLEDRRLKTGEYTAFDPFLQYVGRYQPLYVNSYQMASALHYKTGVPIVKLRGIHRFDNYDLLPESHPTAPLFYALLSCWNDFPQWLKDEYTMEPVIEGLPLDMRLLKFTRK